MSANVNCKVWLKIKNKLKKQASKQMCKYIFTAGENIFKFLNEESLKMKTI